MIQNLHLFEIKYLSATNTKGSRIKIYSHRCNQSVTINFTYKHGNSYGDAVEYLQEKGFNIVGKSEMKNSFAILSDTFEPLK